MTAQILSLDNGTTPPHEDDAADITSAPGKKVWRNPLSSFLSRRSGDRSEKLPSAETAEPHIIRGEASDGEDLSGSSVESLIAGDAEDEADGTQQGSRGVGRGIGKGKALSPSLMIGGSIGALVLGLGAISVLTGKPLPFLGGSARQQIAATPGHETGVLAPMASLAKVPRPEEVEPTPALPPMGETASSYDEILKLHAGALPLPGISAAMTEQPASENRIDAPPSPLAAAIPGVDDPHVAGLGHGTPRKPVGTTFHLSHSPAVSAVLYGYDSVNPAEANAGTRKATETAQADERQDKQVVAGAAEKSHETGVTKPAQARQAEQPHSMGQAGVTVAARPPEVLSAPTQQVGTLSLPAGEAENRALSMVTEYGTLLGKARAEVKELQDELAREKQAFHSRLADLERRTTFLEAGNAMALARQGARPQSAASHTSLPAEPPPGAIIRASYGHFSSARPRKDQAEAQPAAEQTGSLQRYRIQAASPNLAMLTEIARGGDDGQQMQVVPGDLIPNYGEVREIRQRGTHWVIVTDRATIE